MIEKLSANFASAKQPVLAAAARCVSPDAWMDKPGFKHGTWDALLVTEVTDWTRGKYTGNLRVSCVALVQIYRTSRDNVYIYIVRTHKYLGSMPHIACLHGDHLETGRISSWRFIESAFWRLQLKRIPELLGIWILWISEDLNILLL